MLTAFDAEETRVFPQVNYKGLKRKRFTGPEQLSGSLCSANVLIQFYQVPRLLQASSERALVQRMTDDNLNHFLQLGQSKLFRKQMEGQNVGRYLGPQLVRGNRQLLRMVESQAMSG